MLATDRANCAGSTQGLVTSWACAWAWEVGFPVTTIAANAANTRQGAVHRCIVSASAGMNSPDNPGFCAKALGTRGFPFRESGAPTVNFRTKRERKALGVRGCTAP